MEMKTKIGIVGQQRGCALCSTEEVAHSRNEDGDKHGEALLSSLVIRACDPQPVVTQFQLMKFQLHPFRLRQNQNTTRISSCARSQGSRDSGGRNLNGSDGCSDRLRAWIRRAMK